MNGEKLLEIVKLNPTLEIIPLVDNEVCQDDTYSSWYASWGNVSVHEYTVFTKYGNDNIVFREDADEEIREYLLDNCSDFTEENVEEEIAKMLWKKAIFVDIDLPN